MILKTVHIVKGLLYGRHGYYVPFKYKYIQFSLTTTEIDNAIIPFVLMSKLRSREVK